MHRLSIALTYSKWLMALLATGTGCAGTEPVEQVLPIQSSLMRPWQLVEYSEYRYYNQAQGNPDTHIVYESATEILDIGFQSMTTYTLNGEGRCYEQTESPYRLVSDPGGAVRITNDSDALGGTEDDDGGQTRWATFVAIVDDQLVWYQVETTKGGGFAYNVERIRYYEEYEEEDIPPLGWPSEPCD